MTIKIKSKAGMDFAARARFDAERREKHPVEISRNGLKATCTKTADAVDKFSMPNNLETNVKCTFSDLKREEWKRLSLGNKVQITCGDVNYSIYRYTDDAAEPCIKFDANVVK